ncbi:MAG: hypothetical protein DSM106950_34470 [Stigonema ocellatum SAG 48.90 = DSM 106950]|nr:hypothetical protein [Stigonema ocellatum SAG 48.90 = DSM 106950]
MLKKTDAVKTPSVRRLLNLWAGRYTINLSSLLLSQERFKTSFMATNSLEGRVKTTTKFKDNLLAIDCQMAWLQTKSLHNYIPNVLDFSQAKKITESALFVYDALLNIYQERPLDIPLFRTEILPPVNNFDHTYLAIFEFSAIEKLADALEPILMALKEQHLACEDWRTIGFMTTQLKFTNKLILNQSTPIEELLLSPYLKFIEEQVAIPWQRVCAAAAKHDLDSPVFSLVEQMLPTAEQIAETVYHQLLELFPKHISRSGLLSTPTVTQSSLRDLNMFQAYLWLSVLEQSLLPVEQELVNLCLMVMETVKVKWEVLQKWNQILMDEVINRVQPEQKMILLPYTQGMQQAFYR